MAKFAVKLSVCCGFIALPMWVMALDSVESLDKEITSQQQKFLTEVRDQTAKDQAELAKDQAKQVLKLSGAYASQPKNGPQGQMPVTNKWLNQQNPWINNSNSWGSAPPTPPATLPPPPTTTPLAPPGSQVPNIYAPGGSSNNQPANIYR